MLKFPLIHYKVSLIILVLFVSPMACVDLDYDAPPPGGLDPNLPVNLTIAELKERHVPGQYEEITDDVTIAGLVVSNDEAGNFFKQLVIADETGGIEIRIEMTDMHNVYPVGRKVYVKAKGLWIGDYNDLIQLGAGHDAAKDELIRIPESLIDQYIVPATYGNPVIPKPLTLDQLTLADVSTLVKLEGVQFISSDAGETWADAVLQETLNREIENCSNQTLIVRTSGFARFADDLTPEGNGSLIGILSVFRGNYQIMIRDLDDVMMTGDRCGGTGSEEINESFDNVADDADVLLPGWSNIAVKGTRVWRGQVFMGNHYAQATAIGDSQTEMESWLITPAIELDVAKKISFESAYAFFTHDGLTVWLSSNFNGSDVTGATWTQLSPVIAQSSDTQHAFIPSGDIDLSSFSGPVHIGFKYVGSGPGGQTASFRVDNVKVEKW